MVVPSRKNQMVKKLMSDKERKNKENVGKIKEKQITKEEHQERVRRLKEAGII